MKTERIMNKIFVLLFLALISCEQKEPSPFDEFTFSYAGLHYDRSLKFSKNDTVYFQKRFPSPAENFYTLLDKRERIELNKLLKKIDFANYDTLYEQEHLQDGRSLLFNFTQQGNNHWVYIYGHEGPEELYSFSKWLVNFKETHKFEHTSSKIDFGNLRYIIPPPPPPPKVDSIKFR